MTDKTARTIQVSNLSQRSTEHSLKTFFSFCGSVEHLKIDGKQAEIVFERESAAKTASFLNGASLDGSTIDVKWLDNKGAATETPHATAGAGDTEVAQEDKPRSAIAAEYLAAGYSLSDQVVSQSIALDNQHGISSKFLAYWNPLVDSAKAKAAELDQKHQISAQVQATDEKHQISQKAASAQSIGRAYYERALASSWGQQVQAFYSKTSQQVASVHEEARRIADSKKPATSAAAPASSAPATSAPSATGSETTTAPPQATAPGVSQAPVTDVK